ncbi:hypothetical protein VTO42DRAFT_406 [Malbranchea cinnamomea]
MPVTGVYFIPCNPNAPTALSSVVEKLQATYSPVSSGRWALEHKLLRDTPSCLPPSAYAPLPQLQPRSMQFLSHSHYQSHGFIYISNRPDPDPWCPPGGTPGTSTVPTPIQTNTSASGTPSSQSSAQKQPASQQTQEKGRGLPPQADRTMITMDPQSFGSFFSMTLRACEPLWCLRHTVTVQSGVSFTVSDFHVRVGDVRQTHPVNRTRGTVVEIEYRGPVSLSTGAAGKGPDTPDGSDDVFGEDILVPPPPQTQSARKEPIPTQEDWEDGAALIREFWSTIAVPGAREAILVPGIGTESQEALTLGKTRLTAEGAGEANNGIAGVDLARQYMEVFRFNR